MAAAATQKSVEIRVETRKLKRELTFLPLFGILYFTVCGGAFGIEPLFGYAGPGLAITLIIITPLVFSIPNMLIVRELHSMMPVEGGYYHWIKQAFGPFAGFMAGWMNWVVTWVDISICPVLAAYYLGYFIPALRAGAVIGGLAVPAWVLEWLVALVLIWAISAFNIRGARLSGLFTNWLGLVMLVPLVIMSAVALYNILVHGAPDAPLPFLPQGETLLGAFSTGLFVAMWNFMGWELPAAAGDEIVNPRRTYPLAMALVLFASIATYALPSITALYGGGGADGRYLLWGREQADEGAGLATVLSEYGVSQAEMLAWGVEPTASYGWEFPEIAHAVGDKASGVPDGTLSRFLGVIVSFSAVLSMIGLFIGSGLGATRVPFAMAEDGMMPGWMLKVHPRFGTPWVTIIFCGVIFSIFSLQTFAFLVVVDVFLNMIVLMIEFFALWKLRFSRPELPRSKVPGGMVGLVLVTIAPMAIILLAIYSQVMEEGFRSIGMALVAIATGALLYLPIRRYIKKGVPDVDPYRTEPHEV